MPLKLDNKKFQLLGNSDHGSVSEDTTFHYRQQNDIVTAMHKGGGVLGGQILATWRSTEQLEMRYHYIMHNHSLKAEKAIALVKENDDGLIELHLDWKWLGDNIELGNSVYIEIIE